MDIADEKARLRADQVRWRASLDEPARAEAIAQAVTHLLATPAFARADTVAAYIALPGEPDLSRIIDAAWEAGKRVALPVVARRHHPLVWRLHQAQVPLLRGSFRVQVPPESSPGVDPAEIDLVVVPALAIDRRGVRLGYGGGYYDRSLPQMTGARRVWVGLQAQIVDRVPSEPTDQVVHDLITSRGVTPAGQG
jgi:5-formyltetrahydrofolate cyclo-ligase